MYKYAIKGGHPIHGEIKISGSKNAALPLMVASILTDEDVILHNVPSLLDIDVLIKLLDRLGKKTEFKNGTAIIKPNNRTDLEAPYELVKKMRASIIVLGPLLAKHGFCKVTLPGGCAFGPRPVDLHIKGLEALNAKIKLNEGYIEAKATKLKGTTIDLNGKYGPTVLGTDNVMMAATLAQGTTVIQNAACEPECEDLANMLNTMGADIQREDNGTLIINGVKKLHGTEYTIIPDRIESGTFLAMAAASRGSLTIHNTNEKHIESVLDILENIGCDIKRNDTTISIKAKKHLKPFDIESLPYPKFPTDLQSIFTTLACTINGTSSLTEKIYPDRFMHVPELIRMGANIEVSDGVATVSGNGKLLSAEVQASDLRAGAALVIAAVCADKESNIHRIYHIERGYEKLEKKLQSIGINIKKIKDNIL